MTRFALSSLCFLCALGALGVSNSVALADDAAPPNLADLRSAHTDGLPYVALWPVDGFTAAWHAEQLAAGRRVMPSVRVTDPDYWQANAPQSLDAVALGKIAAANVPVVLRTNNIRDAIAKSKRNRSKDPAIAATQGAVYSIKTDPAGRQYADQEPFCDCLAPPSIWRTEGEAWTKTAYFQRLQQLLPNPPALFLLENNEGCRYEQPTRYLVSGGVLKPAAGVQPVEAIRPYSERMANWIAAQPADAVTPDAITAQIKSGIQTQYAAFYDGFASGLPSSLSRGDRLRTAGYGGMVLTNVMVEWPWTGGYSAATLRYDAISPNWYLNAPSLGDFTNCRLACVTNAIPAWEQAEARNPNAWRELSIQITDGAALAGALAGKHKPISPELWSGYCEYLLWAMQSADHRSCVLRHYEGAATRPEAKLFFKETARLKGAALAKAQAGNAAAAERLAQAGANDLAGVTIGDYVLAEEAAASRICENPTLREFWTKGAPVTTQVKPPTDIQQAALKWPAYPLAGEGDHRGRLLPCDANDPPENWRYVIDKQNYTGAVKVWSCAAKHPDGRVLVYAFTACEVGKVAVTLPEIAEPVTVDLTGKSSVYTLIRRDGGNIVGEAVSPR
jgi:hypothetical protein